MTAPPETGRRQPASSASSELWIPLRAQGGRRDLLEWADCS
nr:MAG TPA: hypothetical protein [Caudoviricetes sp.]